EQIGFLIYLGVESIMFITLFATYFILTPSSEGLHPSDIFSVTTIVLSSIFLFSSSGTLIVAEKGVPNMNVKQIIMWLTVTLLFSLLHQKCLILPKYLVYQRLFYHPYFCYLAVDP